MAKRGKKYFKEIGKKGGLVGGRARYDNMTKAERRLYAITNAMSSISARNEGKATCWCADLRLREERWSAFGCSANPEAQIHAVRKLAARGIRISRITAKNIDPEKFVSLVKQLHRIVGEENLIDWRQPASIQVVRGRFPSEVSRGWDVSADRFDRWTRVRKPGRPRAAA